MKKLLSLILLPVICLFLGFCKNKLNDNSIEWQERSTTDTISLDTQRGVLEDYYNLAQGKDSIKYQKKFFAAFPNDFKSFNSLYGYIEGKGAMPLYDQYSNHINFICRMRVIEEEEFLKKLVNLSLNGHWDADAINLLQDCIADHAAINLSLTVNVLKQFNQSEIKSFWFFLFDGPHPPTNIPVDLSSLNKLDPEIAAHAEEAFRNVHKASEHHGE